MLKDPNIRQSGKPIREIAWGLLVGLPLGKIKNRVSRR